MLLEDLMVQIKEKLNIVDIIAEYMPLKQEEGFYYGNCPFCNNKSFVINEQDGIYSCFDCGKAGDLISFFVDYKEWSVYNTILYLCKKAKISMSEDQLIDLMGKDTYKTTLMELNKEAAKFYYICLRKKVGEKGLKYYKNNRKLTKETMYQFGLGFAPYGKELFHYLKEKGYTETQMKDSGLISIYDDGVSDKFKNRVMVPIMNENGQIIAFGGRVLGDTKPKYINSPETAVFDKGRTLFALQFAKNSKREGFILCEGYMDVISMHQEGLDNTIASLGTALTTKHASIIRKYTNKIYLAYDMDKAGREATYKNIPILKGFDLKVINMDPYKDPDEFIQNLGVKEFENRIEKAQSANEFLIDFYKKKLEETKDDIYEQKIAQIICDEYLKRNG